MRIGCCASLDRLEAVKEAGYDFIEMPVFLVKAESADADFEPVLQQLREAEIVPEVWNCLLSPDMKVVGPEVDSYRIERYLRTSFERIEELGGEIVVAGSGASRTAPEGFPMDEAMDQFAEYLALCGKIASTYGITIAVEPLNSTETNLINTLRQGLEIVRRVDHPFVKLTVDLYHMMAEQEPLEHIIEANDEIVHVHVADTGRMQPGSGQYPYKRFFEVLREIGYDERVSAECSWSDFDAQCGEVLSFLRGLAAG